MRKRARAPFRALLLMSWLVAAWCVAGGHGRAAPGAAFVMDGRTGEVVLAENADARLHPASLTKMMTLYVTFDALARGEVARDSVVTVSEKAAAEPGARLGLRAGERISVADLVRAVAVKSANDAATALAEAVAGDEAAFVARMNRTAAAMGLSGTRFRNAHGLTEAGHLSTARDMSRLGRRLRFDFPGRWPLYARLSVEAGGRRVAHTNRRFLSGYAGADGLKTGYTSAAGFNLTASAVRGRKWVIATVFGAPSSAARAARVARLMDGAFASLPERVATVPPPPLRPPALSAPVRGPMAAARPLVPGPLAPWGRHGAAGTAGGAGAAPPRHAGAVALSTFGSVERGAPPPAPDRPGRAAPLGGI